MPHQMTASDSDIRIYRDLHLLAFLTEVKILRKHAALVIRIVHPVVPRILHPSQKTHVNQCTPCAAAVDSDLLQPLAFQLFQFRRRELRLRRIVEIREPEVIGVSVFANAGSAAVSVVIAPVGICPETYIHRLVKQIPQRVLRKYHIVVHHENVIVVPVNSRLGNPVSGSRAIIPSNKSKIGGVSALVQIPDPLIGIREDVLKCRDGDQDSEVFFLALGFFGAVAGASVPLQAKASSHVMSRYFR